MYNAAGYSVSDLEGNSMSYRLRNKPILLVEAGIGATGSIGKSRMLNWDLLKSNKDRYRVRVDDLRVYDLNYHDTQSVALAVSYKFGKSSVKSEKQRDIEFNEIKGRMK